MRRRPKPCAIRHLLPRRPAGRPRRVAAHSRDQRPARTPRRRRPQRRVARRAPSSRSASRPSRSGRGPGCPPSTPNGRPPTPTRPTVLVYGHHDVQPVDPIELWHTDPFEPTREGDTLRARGASDDKGQLLFHLTGVRAHLAATGRDDPGGHAQVPDRGRGGVRLADVPGTARRPTASGSSATSSSSPTPA